MGSVDKLPMGMDVTAEYSEPFVARYGGELVIAKNLHINNAHGDTLFIEGRITNAKPTKEEIFKTQLANPKEIEDLETMAYTLEGSHQPLSDS